MFKIYLYSYFFFFTNIRLGDLCDYVVGTSWKSLSNMLTLSTTNGPMHKISGCIVSASAEAHASVHQSLHCLHTQSMDVDESSNLLLCWIPQHRHLLEAFANMQYIPTFCVLAKYFCG